jgi:putative phage-type endonuclease
METHKLDQGSQEWIAHRAQHWNASDAPAMLGVFPTKTRQDLLHELHTGMHREFSNYVQERILDKGHEWEALARPIAEEILGEELYPVVGSAGRISASFDGLTMDESIAFEHKRLNQELRAIMQPGCKGADLPMHYQVQMEQQCMVSGCGKVLFMASEWTEDGALIEERHCWYKPNKELADKILAGWAQFEADLADYQPPPPPPPPPVVEVIEALPALMIRVEGKVTSSNISMFKEAAARFLAGIKTDLKTDDDFANAAQTVKFCQDGEDRLKLVKEQALAQTASIDELFRTVDHITEQLRQKRLALDKLVTERKASIRVEIVQEHQKLLDEFVAGLNTRLGAAWIGRTAGGFGEAIKGKRTVESVRAAAAQELADQKLRLNDVAATLFDNRKALKADGQDWFFLFADFATLGTKPVADFKAIADARIKAHQDAEAEKKRRADEAAESARVAAEEKAKQAASTAQPQPPVEQPALEFSAPPPATACHQVLVRRPAPPPSALKTKEEPTLKLGDVNAALGVGISMTEAFVRETLKIVKPTPPAGSRGCLFRPSQLNEILEALAELALSKRR